MRAWILHNSRNSQHIRILRRVESRIEGWLAAKGQPLHNLRTSKDSVSSFVNDTSAFMSPRDAEHTSASCIVSVNGSLAVNKLPCSILEVRRKLSISCRGIVERPVAILAIVFSLACAPLAFSQQFPATQQTNGNVESAARSRPLTIPVPKPRTETVDPPQEQEESASFVRVTADGNQLMIRAKDCALSQILDAVRAKTGANIDVSGGTSEHMTVKIGPGPARQVISSLLGWTDFDYVIQGPDGDSVTIQSIMLFPKTKSAQSATNATPALGSNRQPLAGQPRTTAEPVTPPPAPEMPEPEGAAPAQPTADAAPPAATTTPIPTNYERSAANAASMPDPAAGKSTPEMIQNMQQLFEQRRQIQQQYNQTSGAPPLPSH